MSVLSPIDWIVIVAYFVFSLGIALWYYQRAGEDTEEFFLSGRDLPWWVAGTSMVATTFAADTPLAVTELVADKGISGNWIWWSYLFGGMLTVFFFARLWRRAGVLTDTEFIELRYSGTSAAFLRGFRALYFGFFVNCLIMAWVSLAMVTVLEVLWPDLTFLGYHGIHWTYAGIITFPFSAHLLWVGVILGFIAIYAALSGLWGVAVTDFFQFILAMAGTILLAVIAVNSEQVGGISGLQSKLSESTLRFIPEIGGNSEGGNVFHLTVTAFLAYIGVQWWASVYPGSEPGGGGYIAQRMMSAKDERHSFLATLWFTIAHYCLRPWPWIIVALVSLALYDPDNARKGYVMVMKNFLPAGLLGLLVASFFAAFMSTITTQINWGISYIMNDFYRRFIVVDADEAHYVLMSRVMTVVGLIISLIITSKVEAITGVWEFLLQTTAGIGLVLILRWFWWRINAWSEISGMIAPFLFVPFVWKSDNFEIQWITNTKEQLASALNMDFLAQYAEFPVSLYFIVTLTTITWVLFTYLTRPTAKETLKEFYRKVHPGGPLWEPISKELPEIEPDSGYARLFVDWFAGCLLVIYTLFGTGKIIFGEYFIGFLYIGAATLAFIYIYKDLQDMGWETITE